MSNKTPDGPGAARNSAPQPAPRRSRHSPYRIQGSATLGSLRLLEAGPLKAHLDGEQLRVAGHPVTLSLVEFDLIATLTDNAGLAASCCSPSGPLRARAKSWSNTISRASGTHSNRTRKRPASCAPYGESATSSTQSRRVSRRVTFTCGSFDPIDRRLKI